MAWAINNVFNAGGPLPAGFASLFGMTGSTLAGSLSQLSGEVAADAEHGAFQLMGEFLNVMVDPFVDGRIGSYGGQAIGFAPDAATILPPDIALAYAGILKCASCPVRAALDLMGQRLWRRKLDQWQHGGGVRAT